MSRKMIRKKAQDLLSLGYPKQGVYDLLRLEFPTVREKKLANVVRHLPSEKAREHYRSQQQVLLILIVVSAVLQILTSGPLAWDGHLGIRTLFTVIPFSSIALGYAVYQQRGDVYQGLGVFALIGCVAKLSNVLQGKLGPIAMAQWALLVAIGILALHLYSKLYPMYTEHTDVKGKLIVFPAEPIAG